MTGLEAIRALLERRKMPYRPHYDGCEAEHIDCAAWKLLEVAEAGVHARDLDDHRYSSNADSDPWLPFWVALGNLAEEVPEMSDQSVPMQRPQIDFYLIEKLSEQFVMVERVAKETAGYHDAERLFAVAKELRAVKDTLIEIREADRKASL